jgi:hypothetical protein
MLDLLSGKLTEELLFATRTSSHFTIAIMLGEREREREREKRRNCGSEE